MREKKLLETKNLLNHMVMENQTNSFLSLKYFHISPSSVGGLVTDAVCCVKMCRLYKKSIWAKGRK